MLVFEIFKPIRDIKIETISSIIIQKFLFSVGFSNSLKNQKFLIHNFNFFKIGFLLCFSCIISYTISKLNKLAPEFNGRIQNIIDQNKEALERGGIICVLKT